MLEMPFLPIPRELSLLLRTNIQGTRQSYDEIILFLGRNAGLMNLLESIFYEFNEQKKIEQVLRTLGWKHFRDRFTSIYIHKAMYGDYPKATNISLVKDIVFFEDYFDSFSVGSFSRGFLLGLYFKLMEIYYPHLPHLEVNPLYTPKKILHYLKKRTSKNLEVDWLILQVWHLELLLGPQEFEQLIDNSSFSQIFSHLSEEKREFMMKNLLHYGCSIHEPGFFIPQKQEKAWP